MPWRKIADMPEPFRLALMEEIVGTVSAPISTGSGFHILKIEEKRGPFVKYEDQWNVRHILLMPTAIRDLPSTLVEIEDVRNRIIAGEDFDTLAKEFSEDEGSALNGGDLDWFGTGMMVEQFETVMLLLKIMFYLMFFKLTTVIIFLKFLELETLIRLLS